MNILDLFVAATRKPFRFPSSKNELSLEQLWTVPLRSRDDFNLDFIAKVLYKRVQEANTTGSFVDVGKRTATHEEEKLEIVKYIIQVKLAEEQAATQARELAARRQQLLSALESKKAEAINAMSAEEIEKELARIQGK